MKRLRVWWIPQIGMKNHFSKEVSSLEEGVQLMNVLSDYDKFQFENKIKPDYANTGGIEQLEPREGYLDNPDVPEWQDWLDDETGEDNPREFIKNMEKFTTTDQVFDEFVNEGWNEHTKLILIKQFVEKHKLLNRLNEYLEDVVDV